MEYSSGKVGRVFYIRFDHGDDLFDNLKKLIRKEDIRSGWFQLFGGMLAGETVIGPKEPVMPPDPIWHEINEAREIFGTGTVFMDDDKPMVHLHAAMGHQGETITGCVRNRAEIYLIVEAVLYELEGMDITRPWFAEGGFNRPEIKNGISL
ncbi:MAG: DNA-binding protein [Desulfobulbaceae bacterium]|nr:DNA-binding protein [Desulfobulbaceae bacterium]